MERRLLAVASVVAIGSVLFVGGVEFGRAESDLRPRIIRPPDDRADYFASSAMLRTIGDSVCAFVGTDRITDNGNGTFTINPGTLADDFNPLCDGQPFGDQPTAANCTATLIAPDIVITAGHCLDDNGVRTSFDTFYFVFDYAVRQQGVNPSTFSADQVYRGVEVLGLANEGETANDWAVVRLDRAVAGRAAIPVRTNGSVAVGQRIVAIGFGAGLPMKFSDNATVQNLVPFGFEADLDVVGGNSGGPIVDATTGTIEAVLSADLAVDDYFQDGACFRATVCPQDAICTEGFTLLASVMIPEFQAAIQAALGNGGGGMPDDGMGDGGGDDGGTDGDGTPMDGDGGDDVVVDDGDDGVVDDGGDDGVDDDGAPIDDDDFVDEPAGAMCGACGNGAGVGMIFGLFGWLGLKSQTRRRRK